MKHSRIRTAMLAWYDANRRDLPWRHSADPYRVWVAEVMLQQTRVDTVTPYYQRWLAAFPDIASLAAGELDDVLKQWEGLGYYSRARHLHQAARIVRERYAGKLPADPTALRALPGIGDYTAGAIASIAYHQPTPAVDGNVRRVIARLFDIAEPSATALHEHALRLLEPRRPGDFNQALMDFGATLCTPRTPRCEPCPIQSFCAAYRNGSVLQRPLRRPRRRGTDETAVTLVLTAGKSVLLRRRPADGLLAGLWEFPSITAHAPLPRRAQELAAQLTGRAVNVIRIGNVTQTFTHKRILCAVFATVLARRTRLSDVNCRWIRWRELKHYALSVGQRKVERLAHKALLSMTDRPSII
jgi:A/G-specific adenine glycosylase